MRRDRRMRDRCRTFEPFVIPYDPRRVALYSPELLPTLFADGMVPTPLQLATEAARLAYVRAETGPAEARRLAQALARVGFEAPRLFVDAGSGSQAFGAVRPGDGLVLVAFRGTQPDELSDLANDLNALTTPWPESGGRVHQGFAAAARSLLPRVAHWLDGDAKPRNALLLTGHSLGAAIATLAASQWPLSHLVTLGSPRVGDAAFAASLQCALNVRLVNCCDLVTDLPPNLRSYTHVTPPSYITRDGELIDRPPAQQVDEDRLRARTAYLGEHAGRRGAVLLRDLADHAPINYARIFFD